MKNSEIAKVFYDNADLSNEEESYDYTGEGKIYNR